MQQATCAHSGADTGTSPGNFRSFFASRRSVLLGLAAAPAASVAIAAPAIASPQQAAWARAEAYHDATIARAKTYFETVYDPMWKEIDAKCGPQPPRFVEVFAKDGSSIRYPADEGIEYPPFPTHDHCREAQRLRQEWYQRRIELENDPQRSAISDELDRLYEQEFAARTALINQPSPDAAAFATKVQLVLENEDIWDGERSALLADAARLKDSGL